MPELVNHSHCAVCGRAVRYKEKTCSDECRQEHERLQKKRSRTVLIFYAAAAFLIVLLAVQLLGQGLF